MDSWKPSPIRLLWTSPRSNARKTTGRFAARSSTFPSSKLPARRGSAVSAGKTSTPACCPFPRTPTSTKWASPAASSPTKSPTFATPSASPMTSLAPTASPTSIVSPASCAPPKLPRATHKLRKLPKHARALNYSTKLAATSVTSRRSPPPLPALAEKQFHPYGDFLLHDVGTGDGFVVAMLEHYGKNMYQINWKNLSIPEYNNTANKIRTAPLWGVRLHSRLMHDGNSVTLLDAILRHGGEAAHVTKKFEKLKPAEKEALLEFLRSL